MDGFVAGGSSTRIPQGSRKVGDFSHSDGYHQRARRSTQAARQPQRDDSGSIALDMKLDNDTKTRKKPKNSWFSKAHLPKLRTVALVFVIAFGSYFITSAYLKARQVFQGGGGAVALQDNIDPARLSGEGDGRVNVLLLGTDDAGGLTDTIIVASIDPIHDEAALLSIPRDLYVEREGLGSMKINEVFPNERNRALAEQATQRQAQIRGYKAIQDSVSEVIGIPMHYYVSVDFDGFRRAIDTVGGLTLTVEQPVYEVMSLEGQRYVLNVQPGEEHFDGLRALAYVRSRKTSPRGDFDRSERQREMLIALKDEIVSSGTWSNPARINSLFSDFSDNVQTSFALEEIMRLREIADKIGADNVESIELVGEEPKNFIISDSLNGLSIQRPRIGMYDYSEIQNFVRNTLRDGYLRSEDAVVLVMNGTDQPDLAARQTEELESFGYSVATPQENDIPLQRETILVDLTNGEKKYTKRYLEQRLKTFASTNLPRGVSVDNERVDFVILIGDNEVTRLQN
jgi:polyisoprenyl-teichoic acid--peptidoglycan teichoic acid transferase